MLNMLLPSFLISSVSMLSFCIPPESGEKVGLGVTVLLSLSVFLLIFSEQMSASAEPPLVVMYYFGAVLIVTISTGLSVLTSNLHHMSANKVRRVPIWLQRLCFGKLSLLLCTCSDVEINMNTDNLTSGDGASEQVSSRNTIIGVSHVGPIEIETTLIEKFELTPN